MEVRFDKAVKQAVSEGLLSQPTEESLREKFNVLNNTQVKIDSEYYFKQLLAEVNLDELKKLAEGGMFDFMNKEEKIKIFQAPTYFGLARYGSKMSKNFYKNRKIKAEFNAISENLTDACVTGSLTISKEMKKLAKSSFKLWSNVLRNERFKLENKKFMLAMFLLLINDAHDSNEDEYDEDWQDYFNSISNSIADSDSDDEEDSLDSFIPSTAPITRIRYNISGLH